MGLFHTISQSQWNYSGNEATIESHQPFNQLSTKKGGVSPLKKPIFFILGLVCLITGIIGIIIPILPTTPLLLAGAWFFARSSPKFHNWLLYHPLLGQYIRDYIQKKAVKKSVRNRALVILWSGLVITMILVDRQIVMILFTLIGSAVSIHLLKLTVLPETTNLDDPTNS